VPAQQGGRGDHERGPTWTGQQPGQRREQRPVGWVQIHAFGLAAQHGDLVAKDQDLDLLCPLAAQAQHDQLQHLAQDQVSERHDHAVQPASEPVTGNAQNRRSTPETLFSSGTGTGSRPDGTRLVGNDSDSLGWVLSKDV
jgi:hypothetical protein